MLKNLLNSVCKNILFLEPVNSGSRASGNPLEIKFWTKVLLFKKLNYVTSTITAEEALSTFIDKGGRL